MRGKGLGLALTVTLCSGCGGYKPGDRVVTRFGTSFREATVIEEKKGLLTVQWDTTPAEAAAVPSAWAVHLGEHLQPELEKWVLCFDDDDWGLCRIAAVAGDTATVDDASGEGRNIDAIDMLPLPRALTSWAAHAGPRMMAHAQVADATAEVVPATAGRTGRAGARVLAQWTDGTWWLATVQATQAQDVTVAWQDGSAPTTVKPDQVAPLADAPEVHGPAQAAFCAWAQSTRWWKASVSRSSAGALEVAYEDGTRGMARPSDCIPARRLSRR
jgi:hypothetical protein